MIETAAAFSDLLDPVKMRRFLQRELPSELMQNWCLSACDIQHPRFKTYLNPASRDKSTLAVLYRLNGLNRHSNTVENRMLYAKAFLADKSFDVYQNACLTADSDEREHLLHLPAYGLVAWWFPFDPVLTQLPKLLDPDYLQQCIKNMLLTETEKRVSADSRVQTAVVNYRPEIRCTCRHEIKGLNGQPVRLYSKTYAGELGREVFRRTVFLQQRSLQREDGFTIAKPLGYEEIYNTLWMQGLQGTSVLTSLDNAGIDNLMPRLAYALADLHTACIDGLTEIPEADLLAEIEKKLTKLAQAYPHWQSRCQNLLTQLAAEKNLPGQNSRSLIHGDFHIQQLLYLADGRIALFDFDEVAVGNPLIDVANFCADLYSQGLGVKLTASMTKQFVEAYLKFSVLDLNVSQFNWHLRIQLLTRAYRAFIQQKPGREQWIDQFLSTAERANQPEL